MLIHEHWAYTHATTYTAFPSRVNIHVTMKYFVKSTRHKAHWWEWKYGHVSYVINHKIRIDTLNTKTSASSNHCLNYSTHPPPSFPTGMHDDTEYKRWMKLNEMTEHICIIMVWRRESSMEKRTWPKCTKSIWKQLYRAWYNEEIPCLGLTKPLFKVFWFVLKRAITSI